jgi:hypothetical protein
MVLIRSHYFELWQLMAALMAIDVASRQNRKKLQACKQCLQTFFLKIADIFHKRTHNHILKSDTEILQI